jgi:hypothetical protein
LHQVAQHPFGLAPAGALRCSTFAVFQSAVARASTFMFGQPREQPLDPFVLVGERAIGLTVGVDEGEQSER